MRRGRRKSRTEYSGAHSQWRPPRELNSATGDVVARGSVAGDVRTGPPPTQAAAAVAVVSNHGVPAGDAVGTVPAGAASGELLFEEEAEVSDEDVLPYVLSDGNQSGSESDDGVAPIGVAEGGSGPDGADASIGRLAAPVANNGDATGRASVRACGSIFGHAEELYAYLLLRGAKQLTEEQYTIVRAGYNMSSSVPLPSLSHVRRFMAPAVASWLLPMSTAQAPHAASRSIVPVQYVQPSAHIRRDVSFSETYELFFLSERRSADERALHPEFVDTPFFLDRSTHLMAGNTVRRFQLDCESISVGDSIDVVRAAAMPSIRVRVVDAHFSSYRAGVDDDGHIHAGDFVVKCVGDESGNLVARQWMSTELPVLTWIPDADGNGAQDVDGVRVVPNNGVVEPITPNGADNSAGDGGCDMDGLARRRVSSGVHEGERFVVVSLCFSSDDFEARRGRSTSIGGVYMSYLTWRYEDRRSSGASRTIAATPAGVDSDHILRAITSDLVEGATDGWLCQTPDGSALRVYADVSMFVGDYLQVSKTSMMMGYSSKSPCPLCHYRVPDIPGSKYGHAGSSSDVGLARTTARTGSICSAVNAALTESF